MLAQIPIVRINRILENTDRFFEMCMKIVVKIGSTNKVKPMLTENMDENGLTGKEYICFATKKASKQVPIIEESKIVTTNAKKVILLLEGEHFSLQEWPVQSFRVFYSSLL